MAPGKSAVRGLADEAKNRFMLFLICAFGLSYVMSFTSSSVWVNLPVAMSLIIFLRYLSRDLDVRRRSATSSRRPVLGQTLQEKPRNLTKANIGKSEWRKKVNSPAVEEAIDHFTRHLISEWVTDLWYSRITPDKDGPEELVQILNDVLGEISNRAKDVNLIDLLIRDITDLFCNHLERYRTAQSKIGKKELAKLPAELRDTPLRLVLAAERSLHPALFSGEAEHKVLQHLMSGLVSFTFKSSDLQCFFFQNTARELLACVVVRPILNLANPRIINEKIESLVLSFDNKTGKGATSVAQRIELSKPNEPVRSTTYPTAGFQDKASVGVELIQLKQDALNHNSLKSSKCNENDTEKENTRDIGLKTSGNEWANKLNAISTKKTHVLAPEHLENMWARGRNYKKKEAKKVQPRTQEAAVGIHNILPAETTETSAQDTTVKADVLQTRTAATRPESESHNAQYKDFSAAYSMEISDQDRKRTQTDLGYFGNSSSNSSEENDNNNVTGLDSPGTRVWDNKNKTVTRIRHPLENSEVKSKKKSGKSHLLASKTSRTSSLKRRHRISNYKLPIGHDDELSSYLICDEKHLSALSKKDGIKEDLSDDSEFEIHANLYNGTKNPSMSSISTPETYNLSTRSSESHLFDDSFLRLRCEVSGANIVRSGSVTFTVYSIAVTDADNNSWSIKRRFRHFEELHRILKDLPEYNLSLPPKHFLSSGLDANVVQERCILLDKYLKDLLQLPTISRSIEVWDFLSVDSQTYIFSDSLSIIQTLSAVNDDKIDERGINDPLWSKGKHQGHSKQEYRSRNKPKLDILGLQKTDKHENVSRISKGDHGIYRSPSGKEPEKHNMSPSHICERSVDLQTNESGLQETCSGTTIPNEWLSPNLSVPILNLVDVIFQLHGGGWIRRQVFWLAKQVLQLGMGDAVDDWLIEKIQFLRKDTVIASAIKRIEQILWPDGIFITKHPNHRRPTPQSSPKEEGNLKINRIDDQLTHEQQLENSRRAKFVRELIIDKAPVTLVSLVGRKEYERCAEDIFNFIQSPVCLKQLAYELLELLILAAYPELEDVVGCYHEDKEYFGKFEQT